ncbi:MAG: quinone-dependent dihydroorotate dehydrogenase [Gammaproteobacteria bacterium]|nr:quinone-dependent dihydroorotate dehydrogenase [Gammaproteobacteria bacterium]
MLANFYPLLRKALFIADPETAHGLALEGLRLGHGVGATQLLCKASNMPVTVMGLEFPNPVGMAAGMDKNGDYIDALGSVGFGFIEVGTITPRPQPGNPKPRIFRLEQANAMINRLGFNNKGVDHLVRQVQKRRYKGVLGINIGKNFDTPNENAADDYLVCLEKVYAHADYITVNISSPNTTGLRDLQAVGQLDQLLAALNQRRLELADEFDKRVPLVVKVAPDLEDEQIPEMAEAVVRNAFDGLIATNTTISRDAVKGMRHAEEQGGLSGAPVKDKANHVLQAFRAALPAEIALIGTGGITSGADAAEKIQLGADLVQFYTGFVYKGPDLVSDCLEAIAAISTV